MEDPKVNAKQPPNHNLHFQFSKGVINDLL